MKNPLPRHSEHWNPFVIKIQGAFICIITTSDTQKWQSFLPLLYFCISYVFVRTCICSLVKLYQMCNWTKFMKWYITYRDQTMKYILTSLSSIIWISEKTLVDFLTKAVAPLCVHLNECHGKSWEAILLKNLHTMNLLFIESIHQLSPKTLIKQLRQI